MDAGNLARRRLTADPSGLGRGAGTLLADRKTERGVVTAFTPIRSVSISMAPPPHEAGGPSPAGAIIPRREHLWRRGAHRMHTKCGGSVALNGGPEQVGAALPVTPAR